MADKIYTNEEKKNEEIVSKPTGDIIRNIDEPSRRINLNDTGDINKSSVLRQEIFGDGSDGDVGISSNTTLTRDMLYDDLIILSGFTLTTAGYRVFVRGVLTNNGTINNSASGSGAMAVGSLGGSQAAGAAGASPNGNGGSPVAG